MRASTDAGKPGGRGPLDTLEVTRLGAPRSAIVPATIVVELVAQDALAPGGAA